MLMTKHELTIDGLRVRTFELPPHDFNVETATDRMLAIHGIPPRPDPYTQTELHGKWKAAYSRPLRHITPSFQRITEIKHGPSQSGPRNVEHALSSINWSGSVASAPPSDTFKWVAGVWKVPFPRSPRGRCDGNWYFSSAWIGIDGSLGSTDVLQAGTEQDELCVAGQTQQNFYAWWEWFPAASIKIDNFPVAVGDSISCLICAGSTTTGEIFITNQTQNVHTAFSVTATGTTSLTGNCAEWIVERPTLSDGALAQLPDYGEVDFTESFAGTTKLATVNAGSGAATVMQDDFCNNISVGAITGQQTLKCNYTFVATTPMLAAWKGVNNDQGIYYALFDGCYFLPQQLVNGVGTGVGPALASFSGKFFMAWKGVNNDQGIYFSSLNGSTWAAQSNISGIGTSYRPALAAFGGKLYMAWKGVNNDQGIYFSSFDGTQWAPQQNIAGVGTSAGLALAQSNGKLFMAWKGVSNDQGIYFSSFDGTHWAPQQNVSGVGTSVGPSLAVFQGKPVHGLEGHFRRFADLVLVIQRHKLGRPEQRHRRWHFHRARVIRPWLQVVYDLARRQRRSRHLVRLLQRQYVVAPAKRHQRRQLSRSSHRNLELNKAALRTPHTLWQRPPPGSAHCSKQIISRK